MSFVVVIPARYDSTRLPGKPLLDIAGKAMVHHVVDRARESMATKVVVATDDDRIKAYCDDHEIDVLMTSKTHQSGTDRIEEVSHKLSLSDEDVVVNVQGDEPLIPPAVINQVADNLSFYPESGICTLFERISELKQVNDPNVVKVVTDKKGIALYFTRSCAPYARDESSDMIEMESLLRLGTWKRHIGIYAYRVNVLYDYVTWPIGDLEKIEKLEQLRALENGIAIHAEEAIDIIPAGVDTEADLQAVRNYLEKQKGQS